MFMKTSIWQYRTFGCDATMLSVEQPVYYVSKKVENTYIASASILIHGTANVWP